jgi:mannose-1-phosphate guanylyltransferase
MDAMILAAGLGTRLRPYTDHCPKPLFPVLGKPLVSHLIGQLRSSGCQSITINSHYLVEQFSELLAREADVSLQIEEEILGTGGGLRKALPCFGRQPLLVINGDIVHSLDLAEIYDLHLASGAPVSMVVHDRSRFNNLQISPEGLVSGLRVTEEQLSPDSGDRLLAFAGIHVIEPLLLKDIPAQGFYDIIDLYKKLVADGVAINAIEVSDHFWADIGTPADYLDLHDKLLNDSDLAVVTSTGPRDDSAVHLGDGVKLGDNVVFRDWAWVGDGVRIGDGTRVARSVIWNGAEVGEGMVIEDAIVTG